MIRRADFALVTTPRVYAGCRCELCLRLPPAPADKVEPPVTVTESTLWALHRGTFGPMPAVPE